MKLFAKVGSAQLVRVEKRVGPEVNHQKSI